MTFSCHITKKWSSIFINLRDPFNHSTSKRWYWLKDAKIFILDRSRSVTLLLFSHFFLTLVILLNTMADSVVA